MPTHFVIGVIGSKADAEKFYDALEKRLSKFQLTLAPEKTRILEFGKFAAQNRKARDEGKPETFCFLGFTFYCSEDARKHFFRVKVKTDRKKMISKLKKLNIWLKQHRQYRKKQRRQSAKRLETGKCS